MHISELLDGFLSIVGNVTNTLKELFTYSLDLSAIGLGQVNLFILFGGSLLLGYLVYKIVRLLV